MRFKFLVIAYTAALPLLAGPSPGVDFQGREIIEKYLAQSPTQQEALKGVQMDMNIDAKIPKLQKTGTFQALRSISKLGQITYHGLRFIGDNTIKTQLIARYLQAENETKNVKQLAITPENYKFKYKGMNAMDGHLVHVFQLDPRKKSVGLFKGELWLDAQTYLPVRESGRFVKSPSVFIKKMQFIREYEIVDGMSIPKHIASTVDTRLWGPAEMNINYTNFSRQGDTADSDTNQSILKTFH